MADEVACARATSRSGFRRLHSRVRLQFCPEHRYPARIASARRYVRFDTDRPRARAGRRCWNEERASRPGRSAQGTAGPTQAGQTAGRRWRLLLQRNRTQAEGCG